MAPTEIYVPREHKIALCPGVEGVWNDGVYECFAATITAMQDMPKYAPMLKDYGLTEKIPPKEWKRLKDENFEGNKEMGRLWKLFRAQRPKVKFAKDYLYIFLIAHNNSEVIEYFLKEPLNKEAYGPFENAFEETLREYISDGEELRDLFYNIEKGTGRVWLQRQNPFDWQELNVPMEVTLREFRKIVDASRKEGGEKGGYTFWFVTAKGEGDSFSLCDAYRRLGLMGEDEYTETGGRVCMVSRDRIVGEETLDRIRKKIMQEKGMEKVTPEFEKWFKDNATTFQLGVVQKGMNIPFPQIVKIDDRIDSKQMEQIYRMNARQFCTPYGYAFPWQTEEAKKNPFVNVLTENMAFEIGDSVREWGFD
jgi:hypothetical protein